MAGKFIIRLTGWYTFRTEENHLAEFLNRLNEENIFFWGARIRDGYGFVRVSLFDYSGAETAAEGIAENFRQFGLPFIIYKYRKRLGLIVGTVLGLALMFFSSLFVWDVRVTGNTVISDASILKSLSQNGVKVGSFIPGIYAPQAGTRLLLSMPELSSAYVNINGTTVTVDVIERRSKPEIVSYDGMCDVVASEDGVVTEIEAYSGKPVVSHGDVVCKGQLLITGVYLYGAEAQIESNARGKVLAETKKTFVFTVPLLFPYREYTGRSDVKTSYNILGKNFDMFYGPPTNYELFEAEIVTENISLAFLSLPIVKTTLTLREYRTSYENISLDEAKRKAEKAFEDWCANEADGEIISRDAKFVFDSESNSVTIVGRATVIRDIAEARERESSGKNDE